MTATWNELLLSHWSGSVEPAVVDDEGVLSGAELLALASGASAWFDALGPVPTLLDVDGYALGAADGTRSGRRTAGASAQSL